MFWGVSKMDQETLLRICNKLELEGKPINDKNIKLAYKEYLEFTQYNKTPIERQKQNENN